jgi:hypothetical protein
MSGYPNAPDSNAIANAIALLQGGMPGKLLTWATTPITASGSPQAVTVSSTIGLSMGNTLNVDVTNPENVVITAVSGTSFSAIFTKNHGLLGTSWTIGSGSLTYSLVKVGAVTDPTDVTTYCSITFENGMTDRKAVGWRVKAHTAFLIESGFDMSDATLAEQNLLSTRDVLLPVYAAQISLNSTPGVYLTLLDKADAAKYKAYPNGRIYRVHLLQVAAAHEYNITVSP